MRNFITFMLLLAFFVMPASSSFAQKNKEKIVMPQFPGGETELRRFITSELDYPLEACVNKESGEVLVAFSIGMDGYISGVRVVRSVSESLDAEAVRVVSNMPPWIPGKKNGRPVRAEMTIPINFKVNYENKYVNDRNDAHRMQERKFKY